MKINVALADQLAAEARDAFAQIVAHAKELRVSGVDDAQIVAHLEFCIGSPLVVALQAHHEGEFWQGYWRMVATLGQAAVAALGPQEVSDGD
jgi:hypothetical protein